MGEIDSFVHCSGSQFVHFCQTGCCFNGTSRPCCDVNIDPVDDEKIVIYLGYTVCGIFTIVLIASLVFCVTRTRCYTRRRSKHPGTSHQRRKPADSRSTLPSQGSLPECDDTLSQISTNTPPPPYSDVISDAPKDAPPPYDLIMTLPQNDIFYCHV